MNAISDILKILKHYPRIIEIYPSDPVEMTIRARSRLDENHILLINDKVYASSNGLNGNMRQWKEWFNNSNGAIWKYLDYKEEEQDIYRTYMRLWAEHCKQLEPNW